MRKILVLLIILCPMFLMSTCESKGGGAEFKRARSALTRGEYKEALRGFESYLQKYPHTRFSSRAGFLAGKACIGLGDFSQAENWFTRTIEDYPDSLEARKSPYKLALLLFWQGRRAEARKKFGEISRGQVGPLRAEALGFYKYLEGP